jgi:RimJ/RimL family protein N-acetyltransferase
MPPEFFRTPRLLFRPFQPDDLDDLAVVVADPEVVRWTGDGEPMDRDTAALWIRRSRENVVAFGYGTGAVVELASGAFIGWAGIARPEGEPEEVVYGFAKTAWNKGYATELLRGLIAFAFGPLGLPELRATTYPENLVSQRVLRTCGFEERPPLADGGRLFVLPRPGAN